MIEVAVEADGTKHRVRLTGRAVDVEAVGNQAVDDVLDLGFAGPFLHHNDHKVFLLPSPLAFHPSRGSGGPTPPCRQKPTASGKPFLPGPRTLVIHSFLSLPSRPSESMASRSAARASSMMRRHSARFIAKSPATRDRERSRAQCSRRNLPAGKAAESRLLQGANFQTEGRSSSIDRTRSGA